MAELQRLWLIEAVKHNVVPLDDRGFERINPDIAGRPQLIRGNTQLLFPGMRVSEACVLTLKNNSESVTGQITVPEGGAEGVIITQGGEAGGWTLYCHEGKLKYCYNFFGIDYFFAEAERPIPPGKHQVRMEFKYDGGGLAKGGDVTLYYDGEAVGKRRSSAVSQWAILPMRPATSGRTPARRPHPTTGRAETLSPAPSNGCRST